MIKKNDSKYLSIEVVYAKPEKQKLIKINVPEGINLMQAISYSQITEYFPEILIKNIKYGVFGKIIAKPLDYLVKKDDRIEIYRPITADLNEIRKKRILKTKKI